VKKTTLTVSDSCEMHHFLPITRGRVGRVGRNRFAANQSIANLGFAAKHCQHVVAQSTLPSVVSSLVANQLLS
jgi:hypothetical protein